MNLFSGAYDRRKVLVTGHTGFKGSWLTSWLQLLGADLTGISLAPKTPDDHINLIQANIVSHLENINDFSNVEKIFKSTQPEIVFHLAAQPLVRYSYENPLETFETNVMGTANILNACKITESVKAIVIITTDKCYENKEWNWGYREIDALGGHDPYSNSKACAELVTQCFRKSYFSGEKSKLLASARAGNVIGGGDWSQDRLIPDIIRASMRAEKVLIRNPDATRPWQHVLESLSGYLLLGQKLLEGQEKFADAFNFGPLHDQELTVRDLLTLSQESLKIQPVFEKSPHQPHEAKLLKLDCSKAKNELKWIPIWDEKVSIRKTFDWYNQYLHHQEVITKHQLEEYIHEAIEKKAVWTN